MEEQEWDWGRRPAAVELRSLLQTPSPRAQSLEGHAAEGKGQPRGDMPVPLGAAAGLSTKVRLKRDMALVPQAAAAMRTEGPRSFSSIDPSRAGRRPPRGGASSPSIPIGLGMGDRERASA